MTIEVHAEPLDAPDAAALLSELDADLAQRYGDDDDPVHAEPGEFVPPEGLFLVLIIDGQPLACGGYRRWDEKTAELKRMYVRPAGRRRGLARRLIAELEAAAREAGYTQMWLETGLPQHEAMQLYAGAGYSPIEKFGQFAWAPQQRCYGKSL